METVGMIAQFARGQEPEPAPMSTTTSSDSREKSAPHKAKKPLDSIPRPDGHLFTIQAVAFLVKRSERTIYNLLSVKADLFQEPLYQKVFAPRDQRFYRVLTEQDMAVIRLLFPVYRNVFVKRNRRKGT